MPKFKEGEIIIAVHDQPNYEIVVGDSFVVEIPETPCCGGFTVQGRPNHFMPVDFESTGNMTDGTVIKSSNFPFTEEELLMAFNRIAHLPLSAQNGGIPIEIFTAEVRYILKRLGIINAFNDKFANF